jgi:hypothetical protein
MQASSWNMLTYLQKYNTIRLPDGPKLIRACHGIAFLCPRQFGLTRFRQQRVLPDAYQPLSRPFCLEEGKRGNQNVYWVPLGRVLRVSICVQLGALAAVRSTMYGTESRVQPLSTSYWCKYSQYHLNSAVALNTSVVCTTRDQVVHG